jgi:putative ABC transport system permease protein
VYALTWLWGLLRRRPARLAGTVAGIAIAVALLGSLGAFFAASKAHMTRQAAAGVVVDWQVQVAPGAALAPAARAIAAAPGVVRSLPVGYAPTTGLTAKAGGTVQTTGPGQVLGLPPGYAAAFPGEIRFLLWGAIRGPDRPADRREPARHGGHGDQHRAAGTAAAPGPGGRSGRSPGRRLTIPGGRHATWRRAAGPAGQRRAPAAAAVAQRVRGAAPRPGGGLRPGDGQGQEP